MKNLRGVGEVEEEGTEVTRERRRGGEGVPGEVERV